MLKICMMIYIKVFLKPETCCLILKKQHQLLSLQLRRFHLTMLPIQLIKALIPAMNIACQTVSGNHVTAEQ